MQCVRPKRRRSSRARSAARCWATGLRWASTSSVTSGTGQALTPNQLAVKIDELAADINKRGGFPKMIDAETRLDRVSGGPGKKLTYNYTLVNLRANQVNLAALSKFGAGLKAAACASPGSRKILEAGFLLGYAYSATDGYLSSFSVSIFDCV